MNGCCSVDDGERYRARKEKRAEPGHQPVQLTSNYPSRVQIDTVTGDLLVANAAEGMAGQGSVTRIANEPTDCIDRNHNGRIDSSWDVDGNGWIEVDCNFDGNPDDLDSVKAKPCVNGMPQEFYGLDDECVLWTANVFTRDAWVTALGLAAGANGSDLTVWAGSYRDASFVGLDADTGFALGDAQLPNGCTYGPASLVVDAAGIGWTQTSSSSRLCYFDTGAPGRAGMARNPNQGPFGGDGVAVDRNNHVWVGGTLRRYIPDRSNGFLNLGSGWWTRFDVRGVLGVATPSGVANPWFAYACIGTGVKQIPASTIVAHKMDQQVADPGWPVIQMPCIGVAQDVNFNVWAVDREVTTRARVDAMGVITQPAVNGMPAPRKRCPAGDSCPNLGAEVYSGFITWSRDEFLATPGWSILVPGCTGAAGKPAPTMWSALSWDAAVKPGVVFTARARSGSSSDRSDPSWNMATWTMPAKASPAALEHHVGDGGWLEVEFDFGTRMQADASPVLKSFEVRYRCP